MANTDFDPDAAAGPGTGPMPSAPPAGGPAPGGAAPPGGGPIIAALAKQQQGPQTSAPGPGDTANALSRITQAVALIQQALSGLQAGSPVHTAALRAVTQLSRHIPQGQPTVGLQQTQLMDLVRNVARNAMMSKIMGQQQPAAGGPAQQAGPTPPAPSTPLPGA